MPINSTTKDAMQRHTALLFDLIDAQVAGGSTATIERDLNLVQAQLAVVRTPSGALRVNRRWPASMKVRGR